MQRMRSYTLQTTYLHGEVRQTSRRLTVDIGLSIFRYRAVVTLFALQIIYASEQCHIIVNGTHYCNV